jgi:predicted metal-binding membrane protein
VSSVGTAHGTWRLTPQLALVLAAAIAAWVAVVFLKGSMGAMASPPGFGAFATGWALMMAAMMLPSVAPVASLYSRSFTRQRSLRLAWFTAGYLTVWTLSALPAYALAWGVEHVAGSAGAMAPLAVIVSAAYGLYQLTPLKRRCLTLCRSPLWLALRYSAYRGSCRDVRAGMHNGAYCLVCCGPLMSLIIAFGAMSILAMASLAAVVVLEKTWRRGERVARAAGLAALALAVALAVDPALAAGLIHPSGLSTSAGAQAIMTPMSHHR